MEMIYVLLAILQVVAISLGVGCSTVAISSFFVAIADGNINPEERKMLGVVYVLLRVAMVLILLTTTVLFFMAPIEGGIITSLTFVMTRFVLVAALFINALLMTKHIMPSSFGPAIQAGTWYTLGITSALVPLGLSGFSFFEFIIGYLAALALAVTLVNGVMGHLKHSRLK
jgi:hypothetical protein